MNKNIKGILVAFTLALSLVSTPIKAETIYAKSEDGKTNYTSIDDAWSAAKNGTNIIMQADWDLSSRLVLDSNKSATIEMNGHKISRNLTSSKSNGNVFQLEKGSTLNLNGKQASQTSFSFNTYFKTCNLTTQSITSGGLVTGGFNTSGGGGIHMLHGSTLNLDSVAISGNRAQESWFQDGYGGGIYMDGDHDTVKMNNATISYNYAQCDGGGVYIDDNDAKIEMNNSSISYNSASFTKCSTSDQGNGGGVAINDENATLDLSASSIDNNYAHHYGGGIYSDAKYTHITLNDSAAIKNNTSENHGGGIYFNYSNFDVVSTKGNGYITSNEALSNNGGGIFTERCVLSSNSGKIARIIFKKNKAANGAGALHVGQENITVTNCDFEENKANIASAIMVKNDGFTLKNSTIAYNECLKNKSSDIGGALDVCQLNNIRLEGAIEIQNNYNSNTESNVDLLLNTETITTAYVVSAPAANSKIGVYVVDDNTIAKNQNSSAPNIYYANNSSNYTLNYDDSSKTVSAQKVSESASAQASVSNDDEVLESEEPITDSQEEAQTTSYKVTLKLMDSNESWQEETEYIFKENEPVQIDAPNVEGKTFIEYKDVPEGFTVENKSITCDSISKDIEITAIYSDEDSTNTGSIFGQGNITIIAYIVAGLIIIGFIVFVKLKRKK